MDDTYLSKEELEYYIKQNEEYYIKNHNCKHDFHVGEIVIISGDITHDIGYKNKIGIIESWSGIDNYVYVVAYDDRAERFGLVDLMKTTYLKQK